MRANEYKHFHDRIRQKCASTEIEGYFLDGPLTNAYWESRPRIAVLNLEAYGYEKCGEVNLNLELIEQWMRATGGKHRTKTSRYTSVFVAGLQGAIRSNAPVASEHLKRIYRNIPYLISAMSSIAYLNIRKTSNSVRQQNAEAILTESTGEWLCLLQDQFRILDPEIIIVGGQHGCAAANRVFNLNGELRYGKSYSILGGAEIHSVRHFSRVSYSSMALVIERITKSKKPTEQEYPVTR